MLLPRQEELAATSSAEESRSATWSDITPVESCCEHWVPDTASHDSKHSRRKSMLKSPNRPEGDVAEKQPAESRSGTSPGQIIQEVSRDAQHPSSAVSPKSSSSSHHSKHSRPTSTMASPCSSKTDASEKQPEESRSGASPGQIMQEVSRDIQYPTSAVSPKSSSSSHHSKHSRPTSTMASPRRSKTDVAEKRSVESNSGQIMQEVSNDIPYPPMSPKVSSSSHGSTHSRPTSTSKSSHKSKDNVAETQSVESRSRTSPGQIMQEVSRDAQHTSSAVSPKSSSSSHHSKHSRPSSTMAKDEVAEKRLVESTSGAWPGQIMQEASNDIPYPATSPKVSSSSQASIRSRPTSTSKSSHRSKDNVAEKQPVEGISGASPDQIMQEISRDAQHPSCAVSAKSSSSSHHSKHSRPTSTLASPRRSKADVAEKQSVESTSGAWPGQIMQEVSNDIPYPAMSPKVSSSSHGSTHSRPTSKVTSPRRSKTDAFEKQPAEGRSGASPGQIMQEVSRDAQHPSSAVSPKLSSSSHHSKHSRPTSTMASPCSSKTDASEKQPEESRSGASPGQIMQEVSRDIQYPTSAVSSKSSSSSHHSNHSRPSSTMASPCRSNGEVAKKQSVESSSGQIMQEVSNDIQYPAVSPKVSSSSQASKHSRPTSQLTSPRRSKTGVAEKRSVESNSGQIMQEVSNDIPCPAMSPKVSFSSHGSTHSRPTSQLTSPRISKGDAAEKQSVVCISGASPGQIMQEVSSDIQYPGYAVSPKLSSSSNDSMRFGPTSTLKSPQRSKGKVAEKQSVESRPGAMQEISVDMQYPSDAAAPKSPSSSQDSTHSRTRSTLASPRRSKADVDEKKSVDSTSRAWPGQIMQEVSNEMQYPNDALSPKSTSLSHAAVYSSPTSRHSSLCTATGDDGDVQPTMERLSGTWPGQTMTQEDSRGDSRSELSSASPGPPHSRQTSLLSSPIMSSSDVQRAIGVLEHSQQDGDESKDATSELKMTSESNCAPLERLSPRLSSANSITNPDEEKTNVSERERDNEVLVPMRSELLGSTAVESTNQASNSQDETPSSNEQGGSEEQQCPDEEGSATHVAPDLNEQGDVDIDCKTNSHEAIPDMTENERDGSGCEERSSTVNSNVESPYQQDSGESDYDSRPSSVNASDVECLKERRRKPSSCDKWRQSARRSSAMPRRGTIDVNEGERLSVASPDLQPSSPFFVRSRSSLKSAISGTGFREPNDDTEDVIRERTEAPSTDCLSAVEIRPRDADEEAGMGGSADRQDGGIAEGESVEPESRAQSDDGVENVNHEGSLTVVPTSDEYPEVPWVCVAE